MCFVIIIIIMDEEFISSFALSYFDNNDDDENSNIVYQKPNKNINDNIKPFVRLTFDPNLDDKLPNVPTFLSANNISKIKSIGSSENTIFYANQLYEICLDQLKKLDQTFDIAVPTEIPESSVNIIAYKLEKAGYHVAIEKRSIKEYWNNYINMCPTYRKVDKIFMTITNPNI
ncbi:putative ORFan [Tupanvirus deep ocean]|uniref:ORFan n=2 Tax=Tupanvirus TaxID=2094720 RepID=A0AC62A8D7_9VIRU|nr:putative ORFan [Tupanvirus deep ocean]QKU33927.1 putative ORFan [Tupanvirus deep ocean]